MRLERAVNETGKVKKQIFSRWEFVSAEPKQSRPEAISLDKRTGNIILSYFTRIGMSKINGNWETWVPSPSLSCNLLCDCRHVSPSLSLFPHQSVEDNDSYFTKLEWHTKIYWENHFQCCNMLFKKKFAHKIDEKSRKESVKRNLYKVLSNFKSDEPGRWPCERLL